MEMKILDKVTIDLKSKDLGNIAKMFGASVKSLKKMLKSKGGFAALTPTNVIGSRGLSTEFSGDYKLQVLTVIPTSASDTVTLVAATDKIGTIIGVFPTIVSGIDSLLLTAAASFSGLVITLTTYNPEGTAATDWTGVVVRLLVIGK